MNIMQLILKEIKQNVRNKKSMLIMILFPIILILVLSGALKSQFDNNSIGKSKVLYSIQSTGSAAKGLKENIIDKGNDFNIEFIETKDIEAAKSQIKSRSEYDSLILMKDDTTIEVYKNSTYNFLSGLSESIVDTYVKRYNAIAEIAKVAPMKLQEIMSDTNNDYTKIVSVNKDRSPSSLDYYSITMITLIIMYASAISLYGITSEKNNRTRDRILSSPIRKYEFLVGKILGFVCIIILQMLVVILFSKFVLKAYWGNDILPVLLVLLSQIIMVAGMGMGFGFIFNNENTANSIINFMIIVFEFLGGGYIPIDDLGGKLFQTMRNISPVNWINKAIFDVIYRGDTSNVLPAILINLAIATVFIVSATIIFRKESVL